MKGQRGRTVIEAKFCKRWECGIAALKHDWPVAHGAR